VISYPQSNYKKGLFARGKSKNLSFVFTLALAIGLMFFDYHYKYLQNLRSAFALLVSPLQYIVDYPVRIIGSIQSMISSKTSLINENMQLRYQQTMLEAELQRLVAIKEENSQLRELLLTSSKANMKAMAAQILAVDTNTSRQLVILNKGKRDGVYSGQPVLDAKGVMGQIIDVGSMTSTVLLISDSKSAVPVRNNRTGERAILVGDNSLSELSLVNLPKTSKISAGDLLVTSGLGRLYPEGYPVGIVENVQNIPGEAFITVSVSPVALLNRNRLVLLIWPDEEYAKLTGQINERMKVMENNA
jgi:rod shape-determining protein MreC